MSHPPFPFYRPRWTDNLLAKQHALDVVKAFDAAYGMKFPKAAAKITDDVDVLLTFFDYPAEH